MNLISSTLGDADRTRKFIASISSAVAVNPTLQECTFLNYQCGIKW